MASKAPAAGAQPTWRTFAEALAKSVRKRSRKSKSLFGRVKPMSELGAAANAAIDTWRAKVDTDFQDIIDDQGAGKLTNPFDSMATFIRKELRTLYIEMDRLTTLAMRARAAGKHFGDLKVLHDVEMHNAMYLFSLATRLAMNVRYTEFDPTAHGLKANSNPMSRAVGKFWYADPSTKSGRGFAPWRAGSESSLQFFGKSMGVADDQQLENRLAAGYTGPGAYEGAGGLLGRWVGRGAASLASRIPGIGSAVAERLPDAMSDGEDWLLHKYMGAGKYMTEDDAGGSDDDDDEMMNPLSRYSALAADRRAPKGVGGGIAGAEYNGAPYLPDGSIQTKYKGTRFQGNQIINPDSIFTRNPASIYTADDETGDLIIHHREYLRDVVPTKSGFQDQMEIQLNAGLESSFPLLAKFARYYGEYEFQQLIIRYRTIVSEGNDSSQGTIAIATLYNPDAPLYTTKRAIENAEYTASGRVGDIVHAGIECDQSKMAHVGMYYTRRGPLGSANDLHTYDMGKVQIVTNGAKPGFPIGEIWVEYKVRLSKMSNTTLMEPLSQGEGMTVSMTYPDSTAAVGALSQVYGSEIFEKQLPPYPSWKGTTLNGQLQAPGVYRWTHLAAGMYNTGQGRVLPLETGFRQGVPMIAGYSSSPNMGLAIGESDVVISGIPTAAFSFQAVPGAVYTYALTFTTKYETSSMLNVSGYGLKWNRAVPQFAQNGAEAGPGDGTVVSGAGNNANVYGVPISLISRLFNRGMDTGLDCGDSGNNTILPSGYNLTNPDGSGTSPYGLSGYQPLALVVMSRYRGIGQSTGGGLANYIADLKYLHQTLIGPLTDVPAWSLPGTSLPTNGSNLYGGPVTSPEHYNWGSLTFTIEQGPARFIGGTTEVTVPIKLVDGGQFTYNTHLLQAAMSMQVVGNTSGQVVLKVSMGSDVTSWSNPFLIGPAFPIQQNSQTAIYAGNPGEQIGGAAHNVSGTTVSFKRVK